MFELMQKSMKSTAKLGLAVTLLVLTAACAHETIPAQTALEPVIETPEPIAKQSPLSGATVAKTGGIRAHRGGHRKAHPIANSKHKLKSLLTVRRSIHHKNKPMAAALTNSHIAKLDVVAGQVVPPKAPALPANPETNSTLAGGTIWDHIGDYWVIGFVAVYALGLAIIATRNRKTKAKGKGRTLVYNS